MDAAVPVDAKNAPTRDLENRTERRFPQRPHHYSFCERKKKNGQSTSVTKPSTESDQAHLEQADEKVVEKQELLETLESERGTVQAEMEKTYRLYIADQITGEGFGRTYKPLEERLKALEDELPRLQAELDFLRIQNLSRDEVISEAQDLYGRWTDLIPEEKRQIVENVVERITVGKGEVSIDLAYIPSPSEIAAKRQTDQAGCSSRSGCF